MNRSILHCDMNNFYASVECMLDPSLRKYPVAVCGSVEERHGIVLAKNYAAKAFDVKTGDAVWQAKQKCKDLVIVPPHYEEYIKYSKLARSVYSRFTDQLNIKGYKTKFCCSGHPFYSLCEAMVDSEETAKAFVGLIGTERTENPRVPVRALYVTPDNDFYSGFIFKSRYNTVLSPHCVNRAIDRIIKACNTKEEEDAKAEGREPELLPHFSCHHLRHTFCTRFCENETNLKVIQEIMGHADITTTMDIYNEATKDKKIESFAGLEGKIKIR